MRRNGTCGITHRDHGLLPVATRRARSPSSSFRGGLRQCKHAECPTRGICRQEPRVTTGDCQLSLEVERLRGIAFSKKRFVKLVKIAILIYGPCEPGHPPTAGAQATEEEDESCPPSHRKGMNHSDELWFEDLDNTACPRPIRCAIACMHINPANLSRANSVKLRPWRVDVRVIGRESPEVRYECPPGHHTARQAVPIATSRPDQRGGDDGGSCTCRTSRTTR